jgi:pimeloyl-ACP methyl ester carboxylesterase
VLSAQRIRATITERQTKGALATMTSDIELSGTIEYVDTGGEGPAIVLLPGLMMDASLWEEVIADLAPDHRCVAPTLPMGAHRHAMHADADLSPRGQDAGADRQALADDVRAVHAADAPPPA